jgi:hypothetical protein
MEREINKSIYLLALLLAILFFVMGFLISYLFSYHKFQQIATAQEEIRYQLLSVDIENKILADYICEDTSFYANSNNLDYVGNIIQLLEQKLGKNNQQVIEQKKLYSLLEYNHILAVDKRNKECSKNTQIIMFFYSNKEAQKRSEDVGYILDVLKAKYKDKVMVYSFDYDLDTSFMKLIKEIYKINQAPAVIINQNNVIYEINNIEDLEKALDLSQ